MQLSSQVLSEYLSFSKYTPNTSQLRFVIASQISQVLYPNLGLIHILPSVWKRSLTYPLGTSWNKHNSVMETHTGIQWEATTNIYPSFFSVLALINLLPCSLLISLIPSFILHHAPHSSPSLETSWSLQSYNSHCYPAPHAHLILHPTMHSMDQYQDPAGRPMPDLHWLLSSSCRPCSKDSISMKTSLLPLLYMNSFYLNSHSSVFEFSRTRQYLPCIERACEYDSLPYKCPTFIIKEQYLWYEDHIINTLFLSPDYLATLCILLLSILWLSLTHVYKNISQK